MNTSRKEYHRPVLEDLGTAKDLTRVAAGNGYNGSVVPGNGSNNSNGYTPVNGGKTLSWWQKR